MSRRTRRGRPAGALDNTANYRITRGQSTDEREAATRSVAIQIFVDAIVSARPSITDDEIRQLRARLENGPELGRHATISVECPDAAFAELVRACGGHEAARAYLADVVLVARLEQVRR